MLGLSLFQGCGHSVDVTPDRTEICKDGSCLIIEQGHLSYSQAQPATDTPPIVQATKNKTMCDFVDKRLETLRKYKDIIMMFGGVMAAVYIYTDFKAVVREQAETSAKTAEILRTMDLRLSNLEHQTQK